ncbi:MAG TPA: iron uptake transporter deferrochelatase/peroxidase subunit [Candidatus Limnocylindria bacterium]
MSESRDSEAPGGLTRRQLLGLASAGAAGLAIGGIGGALVPRLTGVADREGDPSASAYEFFGRNQSGVTTPVQDHLHFASFDMAADAGRDDLVSLLQDWSYAASRMTQGLEVSATGAVGGDPEAPPDDTGEARDLVASGLTITIGMGPTLFEKDGVDRFGIASRRPPELQRLPPFVGDMLKTEWSHGDLCVQACADDPQVAVHAVRNLTRIAFGRAAIRWSQMGFGRTSKTTSAQQTPRNLMGFKDGTNNILSEDTAAVEEHVWVTGGDGPGWLANGTYLVVRKIEMLIESWDRVRLAEQETIIGRTKGPGAPLSGGDEFTQPDFDAEINGAPAFDPAAHIKLAHPSSNGGIRLLRRGYNYVDGNNPYGRLDAGLFFLAFGRSPEQFIAVQRMLSSDLLNEYIRHVGSAIFAVPPGATAGGFVGETLFG